MKGSAGSATTTFRGAQHGLDHPLMRATSAEVSIQGCAHGLFIGSRIRPQQLGGLHNDAAHAVSALDGLQLIECPRKLRNAALGGDAFDGSDASACNRAEGCCTGVAALAVHQHHARAALLETTAVARARHAEVVAQYVEKRCVGIGRNFDGSSVQLKGSSGMNSALADNFHRSFPGRARRGATTSGLAANKVRALSSRIAVQMFCSSPIRRTKLRFSL